MNSMIFLGQKCHSTFLLLLIISIDDDKKQVRIKSKKYWELIKRKSIFYGNFSVLRSTLMSNFLSILGDDNGNVKKHDNLINEDNKKKDEITNLKLNENKKFDFYNFFHFKDGNNEIKLKNLLNLFIGLGNVLGMTTCVCDEKLLLLLLLLLS